MATSFVSVRSFHAKKEQSEQIQFAGAGITLLDLKREILERKNIAGSTDFDFKITDEFDKEYKQDDEIIPKNVSLIYRRIPVTNPSLSLLARLRGVRSVPSAAQSSSKAEIIVPAKASTPTVDSKPVVSAPSSATSATESISATMSGYGSYVLKSEPTSDVGNESAPGVPEMLVKPSSEVEDERELLALSSIQQADRPAVAGGVNRGYAGALNGRLGGGRGSGFAGGRGMAGPGAAPAVDPNTYVCKRCNNPGHFVSQCPLNNPAGGRPGGNKLPSVSVGSRIVVTSLEGIDLTRNTVIEREDGTFEVFQAAADALKRLGRQSENIKISAETIADAPPDLKCALSGALLREAVSLPCCGQLVNDTPIRQALLTSGSKCPLCQRPGISPEALTMRHEVRRRVEDFIAGKLAKQQDSGQGTSAPDAGFVSAPAIPMTAVAQALNAAAQTVAPVSVPVPIPVGVPPVPITVSITPGGPQPPPPPGPPPPHAANSSMMSPIPHAPGPQVYGPPPVGPGFGPGGPLPPGMMPGGMMMGPPMMGMPHMGFNMPNPMFMGPGHVDMYGGGFVPPFGFQMPPDDFFPPPMTLEQFNREKELQLQEKNRPGRGNYGGRPPQDRGDSRSYRDRGGHDGRGDYDRDRDRRFGQQRYRSPDRSGDRDRARDVDRDRDKETDRDRERERNREADRRDRDRDRGREDRGHHSDRQRSKEREVDRIRDSKGDSRDQTREKGKEKDSDKHKGRDRDRNRERDREQAKGDARSRSRDRRTDDHNRVPGDSATVSQKRNDSERERDIKEKDKDRRRDRDKEVDKDRDRERNKEKEKPKERDRERDRNGDRTKGHERERDRNGDRGGQKEPRNDNRSENSGGDNGDSKGDSGKRSGPVTVSSSVVPPHSNEKLDARQVILSRRNGGNGAVSASGAGASSGGDHNSRDKKRGRAEDGDGRSGNHGDGTNNKHRKTSKRSESPQATSASTKMKPETESRKESRIVYQDNERSKDKGRHGNQTSRRQ